MSDLIYLQLSLPANKVQGYTVDYSPSRLPQHRYRVSLSGSLTYIKDNFDRWVYLDTRLACGQGETIAEAVETAIADLDRLFAHKLAEQNAREPKAIVGLSTRKEVDDLASLLGL